MRFCLATSIVLALTVFATSRTVAAPYVSPSGFSLIPPEDWRANQSSNKRIEAEFLGPETNGFHALMTIIAAPLPANVRNRPAVHKRIMARAVTNIPAMYARQFTNFKLVRTGATTVDGVDALVFVFTHTEPKTGKALSTRLIDLLKGNYDYSFTLTTALGSDATYDKQFRASINTFHWID